VKFKDAELVGIPFRITVGSRDLADGLVEVVSRSTGDKERVPIDDAVRHVHTLLAKAAG
jgi:prolyl-tRNA synthetase